MLVAAGILQVCGTNSNDLLCLAFSLSCSLHFSNDSLIFKLCFVLLFFILIAGIPCKHAICVLDDNQDDAEKYVPDYYSTLCLKNTYADNIRPVNGEKLWNKMDNPPIGIPDIRKPRGRPKNATEEKNLLNHYKIQVNLQDTVKLDILKVDVKMNRSL